MVPPPPPFPDIIVWYIYAYCNIYIYILKTYLNIYTNNMLFFIPPRRYLNFSVINWLWMNITSYLCHTMIKKMLKHLYEIIFSTCPTFQWTDIFINSVYCVVVDTTYIYKIDRLVLSLSFITNWLLFINPLWWYTGSLYYHGLTNIDWIHFLTYRFICMK